MKLIKFTSYFIPVSNGNVTNKTEQLIGKGYPYQWEEYNTVYYWYF